MRVSSEGVFEVLHKGVRVVHSAAHGFGPKWTYYATTRLRLVRERGAPDRLSGDIPKFGAALDGNLTSPAPNALRVEFTVRAEKDTPDVIGACWDWTFRLESPTFPGKLPAPELLPDNGGWIWKVGTGQAVALRVEGFAKVQYERPSHDNLRCFYLADNIERGTRRIAMTLELPEGGRRVPMPGELYDPPDPARWFPAALSPDESPVDLSFLNKDDRPAGRRGFIRADGDRLVFEDGTPARFWGANIASDALFDEPREKVVLHARRLARLGYNLVRIHQHDAWFASPNIFGRKAPTTRRLDPKSLDGIDWWVKCLEDEGIYVWLDMHYLRAFQPGDDLGPGADEVARQKGRVEGLSYYNRRIQELMKEFQHSLLNHLNPHTKKRYKDDPGVVGILITNENDLVFHFGHMMLPVRKFQHHSDLWARGYKAFASRHGLPEEKVAQTWQLGPSKLYLAQAEHEFNETMIGDLRSLGVRAPIATTNLWGTTLYALPSLSDGDIIDVHSYGKEEELGKNPRFEGTFGDAIAMGQVYGKPLTVSEWNVEYPIADRFIAPLYVASMAALQSWDAAMILCYTQSNLGARPWPSTWDTYHDPSRTGLIPAAALLYRRGHVRPAEKTYCLMPDASTLFGRVLTPDTSATIRTLAEQSRLTIGMPRVPELPWLKPTEPGPEAIVVTDPDHDYIPEGQDFVRSDTGELTRDWKRGIQVIDTPKTQAVVGWVGGQPLKTRDASFEVETKKAAVVLSSVDDRPLAESRFILVTAIARTIASPGNQPPYLSEPVRCRITLRSGLSDPALLALGPDGRVVGRPALERRGDSLTFRIPAARGTHWYVLKSDKPGGRGATPGAGGATAPRDGRRPE